MYKDICVCVLIHVDARAMAFEQTVGPCFIENACGLQFTKSDCSCAPTCFATGKLQTWAQSAFWFGNGNSDSDSDDDDDDECLIRFTLFVVAANAALSVILQKTAAAMSSKAASTLASVNAKL